MRQDRYEQKKNENKIDDNTKVIIKLKKKLIFV